MSDRAPDESYDEYFFRLTERRRANAASSETWIEAPRFIKDNVPLLDARKDTVQPQPSPTKTRSSEPFENAEDEEF